MSEKNQLVLFKSKDGGIEIPVRMEEESLWLTRMQMAELFDVTPQNITLHMRNVYKSGELDVAATSKESLLVQNEGGRRITRKVITYNLDAIISVGYRVNSTRATQFRIWATKILREYILHGYVLNQQRLRQLGQAVEVMKRGSYFIHRRRRRRRTSCISSRRTTASPTGTSASRRGSSSTSSSATGSCCARTAPSASPTRRLSR